jgi:hypothetical protein
MFPGVIPKIGNRGKFEFMMTGKYPKIIKLDLRCF